MALSTIHTFFSGSLLDRADHLRTEPDILGTAADADDAKVMILAEDQILTGPMGEITWLSPRKCKYLPVSEKIFLGISEGVYHYAAALNGAVDDFADMFTDDKFRDARGIAMKAGHAHPELGIIAQAKSILSWHTSHRFCSNCGAESRLVKAGYERQCDACGKNHFPRTDPVVIMLACHGDKALLGRGPHLPPNFFSALAGFMEPGETIEEAVARELMEEAGVTATSVEIVANQPWPWPSSLMVGCMAQVENTKLTLDEKEIDDARWFSKEDVKASLNGETPDVLLPPAIAIAHDLIQHWLKNG